VCEKKEESTGGRLEKEGNSKLGDSPLGHLA